MSEMASLGKWNDKKKRGTPNKQAEFADAEDTQVSGSRLQRCVHAEDRNKCFSGSPDILPN